MPDLKCERSQETRRILFEKVNWNMSDSWKLCKPSTTSRLPSRNLLTLRVLRWGSVNTEKVLYTGFIQIQTTYFSVSINYQYLPQLQRQIAEKKSIPRKVTHNVSFRLRVMTGANFQQLHALLTKQENQLASRLFAPGTRAAKQRHSWGTSIKKDVMVILHYCIAHPYCARFSRQ